MNANFSPLGKELVLNKFAIRFDAAKPRVSPPRSFWGEGSETFGARIFDGVLIDAV